MMSLPYWFVTRPHRKLIRVPKSLAAFAGVAAGRPWNGDRAAQIAFEEQLERLELKRRGDHTERDRGRGGSGGRTHAQLLYALGLYFYYRESEDAPEEVHLTTAGEALVDQQDALPILRKQALAFQFPSAYSTSSSVDVDRKFRLRPLVLLLRLLRHGDLEGYLTNQEIAACVIGYATSHSARDSAAIVARVLQFREHGFDALDPDFSAKFSKGKAHTSQQLVNGTLNYVADTFAQWLRYTGYARAAERAEFGLDGRGSVTALNTSMTGEIDEVIDEWGRAKPLLPMPEDDGQSNLTTVRRAAAFQRTYGVCAGTIKDSRVIHAMRRTSERERVRGLVSSAISHLYTTDIVTRVTPEVVDAIVNHTGLDPVAVEHAARALIATPQEGLGQFLARYQQMAFAGRDEAIAFEKATASVMRDVFRLKATHIGQGGRVPDIEVLSDSWVGIVDTKAYSEYGLESDHQLRMQTSYLPAYADGVDGKPLRFFLYVAGGFAPSFSPNLRKVVSASGISGAGISIRPWLDLIQHYDSSNLTHEDLLGLWTLNREITPADVGELIDRPSASWLDRPEGRHSSRPSDRADERPVATARPASAVADDRTADRDKLFDLERGDDSPTSVTPRRATTARKRPR